MSGLTIPTGGVNPGRGFQAQPVEVDQSGEVLAQLGDTMARVGVAVENDRLDREMQRHQVDLTKDVNDLVLEAEQIGDPDAAEAHWQTGVQALQSRYMQPGPEGRPRVSKRNQERFQLQFDDLTNAASVGLGRRFIGQRRAQREGNYIDLVDQTIRSAAAAPLSCVAR
ncbi:hypothetical protein CDO87_03405 [Sagittula sp. P11]|uniref:hypothetical protein n=1 Tax=Sagittula sp. P11 TaxID=2009329 RepID=UPI000C2CFCA5|nr:hypothetical protein [Sagittula sp. P11]AUC52292.1 hypothetical protein CDO87_03405 [Sagittula sp. P11]